MDEETLREWDEIAEYNLKQLAEWFSQEPNPELVGVNLENEDER